MKAYPYTSIQLIEDKIKAVCNKEAKPSVGYNHSDYNYIMMFWQKRHEVFEFANPHEEGKIMRCIGGMNPQIIYGLEVTCIEIKDGLAYFKEETNKMEKTAFSQYLEDTLNNNIKSPAYYLELEKKQLIEAYRDGFLLDDIKLSSEYYTKKFNK